jgi:hypothetical protein
MTYATEIRSYFRDVPCDIVRISAARGTKDGHVVAECQKFSYEQGFLLIRPMSPLFNVYSSYCLPHIAALYRVLFYRAFTTHLSYLCRAREPSSSQQTAGLTILQLLTQQAIE